MRRLIVVLMAAGTAALAAPFDGRWDITILSEPRHRAAWLEITGSATGAPKGRYVSAFDGDMNVIEKIAVHDGELEFGWPGRKLWFKARLAGERLEGVFEKAGTVEKWVAVRAPAIADKDDGTWREGKPVSLLNGRGLAGWRATGGGAPVGWSVKDGVLAGNGEANDIISEQKFWNFQMHVEFRMFPHSNSGVGLRGRYEVQVLDDYGRPPNTHSNGALYSRIAPAENASKPAGEWQSYDIRLVGRQVTVVLNGKTLIDQGEIEGLTAIAGDADEAAPGPLYLQGDHGPVEYRNIVVTPLVK
jgi:hypothetical protein